MLLVTMTQGPVFCLPHLCRPCRARLPQAQLLGKLGWLCSCRTVAFLTKASLGSSVRGWVPLRRKEVHRFSLHCAHLTPTSTELGLNQGGLSELLLVQIQWYFLRSLGTTSLEHVILSPFRSSLSFLLLGGCTIQFVSCFPDLLWALIFCL